MNQITIAPSETLPKLIDRATQALQDAKTSAEVLEARDMARIAYDAAKTAGRIAKAKQAHDSILADVYRSQAHATAIRARAEMRLAEEYDAAQERGEVGKSGARTDLVSNGNEVVPSAADLGLSRKDIHEGRKIRDAERENPGIVERTLNGFVERGEEPTRAALRREIANTPPTKPRQKLNPHLENFWGNLEQMHRDGTLDLDPAEIVGVMVPLIRENLRRDLPRLRVFIDKLEPLL